MQTTAHKFIVLMVWMRMIPKSLYVSICFPVVDILGKNRRNALVWGGMPLGRHENLKSSWLDQVALAASNCGSDVSS